MRTVSFLMCCVLAAAAPAIAGDLTGPTLPPVSDVVALFEFDGNANDTGGNNRQATLLGIV